VTEAARLLRHARRRAGLSQRALATKVGVPQSYVARVESGRVDPSVGSLSRLLRGCGATLESEEGTGEGVDRTQFKEALRRTVRERLAAAAADAAGLDAFLRAAGR
jgi:predicted transcriptional regulator